MIPAETPTRGWVFSFFEAATATATEARGTADTSFSGCKAEALIGTDDKAKEEDDNDQYD